MFEKFIKHNLHRLSDKVRMLKIQEFLHLLSKVLGNIKTMLARVQVIKRLNLKNKIQLNLIFFIFLSQLIK